MPPRSPVVPPVDCPECPPIGTLDWQNLKEILPDLIPVEATEVSEGVYESGPFSNPSNVFGLKNDGVIQPYEGSDNLLIYFLPEDDTAFVSQIQYGIYGPVSWYFYDDFSSQFHKLVVVDKERFLLPNFEFLTAYPKTGGVTTPVRWRMLGAELLSYEPPE